jgi:hypothetical protein
MRNDHLRRPASLVLGVAMMSFWAIAGCDSGSGSESVKVAPEAQKKTEEYLQNYQKSMYDKHQAKGPAKNNKRQ